ncbi:SirB2 family protein [Neptunicella marina]|uniref:SirB2 family protein n=1 Tax=Neptunicella marina TaxID=2125989 RepID=A0A8J6LWU4_9ALTE|nr:SirB2 family protein [Neptunicella marina]MBC3764360.1 SirB2 family protein [Neptunicella marina]
MYLMFKHLHMTFAVISIVFFIVRFVWRITDSALLQKKIVKILPHIVDTLLLVSAFALCFVISQYPFATGWLTEKFLLLIAYIVFGVFALKKAQTRAGQWGAFALAMACIYFIVNLAISKQAFLLS